MIIIKVDNVSFGYSQVEVLRNLSFEVEAGSFLGVAGPNGAGKSTLLRLLCYALRCKSGSIDIDSLAIESYTARSLARKVAVVRQEFVPVFGFTVTELVAMARSPYLDTFGFETKEDREIITEALEVTETAQFASRTLSELSGGERQRVFIARALAQDTPILLLDEPTSFLDLRHQVVIYDLLKKMQLDKGKTIVVVTHDVNLAGQYCDQCLLIGGGTDENAFFLGESEDVLSPERIESVFGVKVAVGKAGGKNIIIALGEFSDSAGDTEVNLTDSQ
jgi:iron complex transport system ATP-binding protein